MGLGFILGPSGSGKSTYVQDLFTKEAKLHREKNYLMIVPDQFTMQTQKIMADRNPDGGILNIDVLSFGRLTHRIFEEVGRKERILLDDLGKCLILRRVIQEREGDLQVLKKGIHTPGYVEEVKSVLSEFMQYGVRPEDLEKQIREAGLQPGLKYKLEDFLLLYRGFLEALEEKYTTKEDTLCSLIERIPLSRELKKSILVFDGFTGFTPLQVEVISTLLQNTEEILVTLPLGKEALGRLSGEPDYSEMFYLTKKTVRDLERVAKEAEIPVREPVFLDKPHRHGAAPALAYLERNLFRPFEAPYPFECKEIVIRKAKDETHECMILCRTMAELIETGNYRLRDMAVVCGDLAAYSDRLKVQFEKYGIPYFMDSTTELRLNPFVNYLELLLRVVTEDYPYRDTSALLKNVFLQFDREQTDKLDNYMLAKNIRGRKKWKKDFSGVTREMKARMSGLSEQAREELQTEFLKELNEIRGKFVEITAPLEELRTGENVTARQWMTAIYRVLEKGKAGEKLFEMAEEFEKSGDGVRAQEYSQVYKLVMDLFDQVVSLIGDEVISLEELFEVLDTGFGEIRIGIIPKSVDVLPVCDLVRSRFGDIRVLFFLGLNDGNIPKVSAGGGLLSDLDRSSLMEQGMELAPNRAMENFAEQLYLYQVLTKPSQGLYLSFLSVTEQGDSRLPSYLVGEIRKLFPELDLSDETMDLKFASAEEYQETLKKHNILSKRDLKAEFADYLGRYLNGSLWEEECEYTRMLCKIIRAQGDMDRWLEQTVEQAFQSYQPTVLARNLAKSLYGEVMECSVSSLEKYAGCAYAHFLTYGLALREREAAEIEPRDLGNVTHEALEAFGKFCKENHEEFAGVSRERTEEIIDAITGELLSRYEGGLFLENENSEYLARQVKRVLHRSVNALKEQLRKGDFSPFAYEEKFSRLLEGGTAMLVGKIDRVDLCREEGKTYVKIVDYKSGSKDFNELLFQAGVQLQTTVYLSEAIKKLQLQNPGASILPGAMLYFRMQDPYLEIGKETEEEIQKLRNIKIRPTGVVSGQDQTLLHLEKERVDGKSEILPVTYKGGSLASERENKSVHTEEDILNLLSTADRKVQSISEEIREGHIEINPLQVGNLYDACEYCSFKNACGFDERLRGYKKRTEQQEQRL